VQIPNGARVSRPLAFGLIITLSLCFAPLAQASSLTTSSVGAFSWGGDDLFGSWFNLSNDSATAGLSGDFSSIVLTVAGDFVGDGSPQFADVQGGPDTLTSGATWYEGSPPPNFTTAVLTFNFLPTLPAGASAIDGQSAFRVVLNGPADVFLNYSYLAADPASEPAPVPEPGSLLLLGPGLAAACSWHAFKKPTRAPPVS
jgi:hypothetical protein